MSSLQSIQSLLATDLAALNSLILGELRSTVPLIETISQYIVENGGKRARPIVLLLAAKALGIEGREHYELAAVVEFIHTATLLHDDVVDQSDLRRGHQTANIVWGNEASVLVGDFLYSRAFQILAKRENVPVMKILAHTTNALSEGEMLQLVQQHEINTDEKKYLEIIERKTAKLFQAAAQIGAMLASSDTNLHKAFSEYGYHLGMAYQITDDLLDYTGKPDESGKNLGNDLQEGKMTLPLIYAVQESTEVNIAEIKKSIEQNENDFSKMIALIQKTSALDRCKMLAQKNIEKANAALQSIPHSPYRDALLQLSSFIVNRSH